MNVREKLEDIEEKMNQVKVMTPRLLELTLIEIYKASGDDREEAKEYQGFALALEMKALLLTIGSDSVNYAHELLVNTYCGEL